MERHKEQIICPNCGKVQEAIVEQKIPFWSYVHECKNCNYIITESEWNRVRKPLVFHLKKIWFDKIKSGEKTHEFRSVEKWKKQICQYFIRSGIASSFKYNIEKGKRECILFPLLYNGGLIELCCGYPGRGEKEKWLTGKIVAITANVSGLETDLKIDEPVFDIKFELITKGV